MRFSKEMPILSSASPFYDRIILDITIITDHYHRSGQKERGSEYAFWYTLVTKCPSKIAVVLPRKIVPRLLCFLSPARPFFLEMRKRGVDVWKI